MPAFAPQGQAHLAGNIPARYVFSIDVELKLAGGGVADAYGLRAFVTGHPIQFELCQPPGAEDVVHDLQVRRIARNRSYDPVAKTPSFVDVAASHKCIQGQARVS